MSLQAVQFLRGLVKQRCWSTEARSQGLFGPGQAGEHGVKECCPLHLLTQVQRCKRTRSVQPFLRFSSNSSSPHTFCHLPNVDRQIAGIGNLMYSFFFSPEELSHSDGADPFKAYHFVLYHFLFYLQERCWLWGPLRIVPSFIFEGPGLTWFCQHVRTYMYTMVAASRQLVFLLLLLFICSVYAHGQWCLSEDLGKLRIRLMTLDGKWKKAVMPNRPEWINIKHQK